MAYVPNAFHATKPGDFEKPERCIGKVNARIPFDYQEIIQLYWSERKMGRRENLLAA